jgi:hypothetical protein
MKTLTETFYKKNSDLCTKNDVSFKKKPIKPKNTRLEVGFFRRFFFGFYWAGFLLPTLIWFAIYIGCLRASATVGLCRENLFTETSPESFYLDMSIMQTCVLRGLQTVLYSIPNTIESRTYVIEHNTLVPVPVG